MNILLNKISGSWYTLATDIYEKIDKIPIFKHLTIEKTRIVAVIFNVYILDKYFLKYIMDSETNA